MSDDTSPPGYVRKLERSSITSRIRKRHLTRDEYLNTRSELMEQIALGNQAKEWLRNLENNQVREFFLKETVQECFDCKNREPVELMSWHPEIGAGLCLDCSNRRHPFKSNISPL